MSDRRVRVVTYIDVDMLLILDRICKHAGILRDDFINSSLRGAVSYLRGDSDEDRK
ncbi:hypothetical protein [Emergencia sp.]|uniref:hypothetical protein n=1 Tax=Emergencia sp. TaxID=1926557 RepID=UPI003AEF75E5